jgi:hypothetical protein
VDIFATLFATHFIYQKPRNILFLIHFESFTFIKWLTSCPPLALAKAFSRSGCGRIFPLSSRVMRVGLSTGLVARRRGSRLSGPVFSVPHDCADLVNSLQSSGIAMFFQGCPEHFDAGGVRRDGTDVEPVFTGKLGALGGNLED